MKDERGAEMEDDEGEDEISLDDFESEMRLDEIDEGRLALRQASCRVDHVAQDGSLEEEKRLSGKRLPDLRERSGGGGRSRSGGKEALAASQEFRSALYGRGR